ncbi:class I SAM-dependent methyltransferase [Flavobacterium sp.]|uniref:class I SAM-dependent methyltransferase n=1 Tax=Flavobacterium sp. TaxID=239 RepID=UPI00286D66E6|nr:class I SAM-dependent methyltransferase [Flavobacterium sp.]
MAFKAAVSYISFGDFVDSYYKIQVKGMKFFLSKFFKIAAENRVSSKWDTHVSVSDFWVIPEIKQSWNIKISGDANMIYEDYVYQKYLKAKSNLHLLSVGCGDGTHERNFAKYTNFEHIAGVDVSPETIKRAKKMALEHGFEIDYFCDDFFRLDFSNKKFDVILFNASLHHFDRIDAFLHNHIAPLLNENGLVVVFEYCGPNRLQWRKSQLDEANRLLQKMPNVYKTRIDGKSIKRKVYRPGLLRMFLVDPSEAPDSENLAAALKNNFVVLEEKKLGWNILHLLLKDIAHNFLNEETKTKSLLSALMTAEDDFVLSTQENDAVFGVYQKRTT